MSEIYHMDHNTTCVRNEYERRISAILSQHNPAKLTNVQTLLQKYAGKEHSLYMRICSKYSEPKMKKFIPPPRENLEDDLEVSEQRALEGALHEREIERVAGADGVDGASENEEQQLSMEDRVELLEKKILEKDSKVEEMHMLLGAAKDHIAMLEREQDEARGALSRANEQITSKQSDLDLAEQTTKELKLENSCMKKKFVLLNKKLKAPAILTSPFFHTFTTKQLYEQDKLLCKLSIEIADVRAKIREKQEEEKQCKICYDGKQTVVLNPCGHAYCLSCANQLTHCAFCKQQKISVITTFH